MKKILLLLLTTILSLNSYSQITFEKGYYIDNNNQKIKCLIMNADWKNNPTKFKYKLSENGETKIATIKSVKEFSIDNISKYIRSTVNIDRSSASALHLSNQKRPIFKQEDLLLKALIEGKANLYEYVDGFLIRYFYSKDALNIKQLTYKMYKPKDSIRENNGFRQQLWTNLNCSTFKISKVKNMDYEKNDLMKYFTEYNKCHNNLTYVERKEKRDLFNLTIRPRLNYSSLDIQNSRSNLRSTDFGNKITFNVGLEAEYILPFNKNKWSIAIEATYQKYKSDKTINTSDVSGGKLIKKVDYNSIEFPVSLRYYFFLNNESKIFINASYIFDLSPKSSIEFLRADNSITSSFNIRRINNFAFGIGYKLNDRFVLEMRYQTNKGVISHYLSWTSNFKYSSLIFGYSLF